MNEITLKDSNARALRAMMEQANLLQAQFNGAVGALALALDVPPDWVFSAERMAFVAPVQPQGTPALGAKDD